MQEAFPLNRVSQIHPSVVSRIFRAFSGDPRLFVQPTCFATCCSARKLRSKYFLVPHFVPATWLSLARPGYRVLCAHWERTGESG
jgi:hypothetical protein